MFRNKDYILTILREGSFTKAAEKLFISQPSLSATVKRIEEKAGVKIFDRSSSPITLTEVGEIYLKFAVEIEQKEKEFVKFLADYQNLLNGKIKIGGSSFFSSFILPNLISNFNKEHPQIELKIYEDSTKNLKSKLLAGELDLILDNTNADDDNIVKHFYAEESLLLAVPKSFEPEERYKKFTLSYEDVLQNKHLKDVNTLPLTAFSDKPFILLSTDNDTGRRAETLLKKHGVKPKVLFNLDQQVTAYNVCLSGLGITLVSDTLVKKLGKSNGVSYYKIGDSLALRKIYLCHKKNHYLSVAVKKFIEYYTK